MPSMGAVHRIYGVISKMEKKKVTKSVRTAKATNRKIAEKETARVRRRKARKRIVLMEKIAVGAVAAVVIGGIGLVVWKCLPDVKVAQQLEEANGYIEAASYDEAIASYQEALEIDSKSVKAYRAMAGAYLTIEDTDSAEQVLYQGWETTQDESLLQYYCTVLLNEAVAEINAYDCDFNTVSNCVAVLEKDVTNADAYEMLDVLYTRLLKTENADAEQNISFCDSVNTEGGLGTYIDSMNRMMNLYDATGSEELKNEIITYAVPQLSEMVFDVASIGAYNEMLNRVSAIADSTQLQQMKACLDKSSWVQDTFAPAFVAFDSGQFELIKEFMNSETYVSIRDEFINGTMEYWNGKTYIPVSREKMKLICEDGNWTFAFLDYESCPETKGIINVWGAKQEDAGVQRLAISYEPVSAGADYYPHTTYEIIYLYCNVEIDGEYVPQMNYRFETKVATEEGLTTDLIGDWGGEHEWETSY